MIAKQLLAGAAIALSILILGHTVSGSAVPFRFVILGDRTGETVDGVYEAAWRTTMADHPDFVLTVGDTIQGGNDETGDEEWKAVLQTIEQIKAHQPGCPLFLTPGNHDVWSGPSATLYERYSKRPLHYGFDWKQLHVTVLDNSRTDNLSADELQFLENDLRDHQAQPIKFIVSHRPSWLLRVLLANPKFPLHQLALRYGVKYVIAGHLHQMLRYELDGVTYVSMASAGGHLRDTKRYEKGWFFAHALVTVHENAANIAIKELGAPYGKQRVTRLEDWDAAGLARN